MVEPYIDDAYLGISYATALKTCAFTDTNSAEINEKIVCLENRIQQLEDVIDWIFTNIEVKQRIDFEELMNNGTV